MNNWSEILLKDICDITRGASPRPIHDFMTEDLDGIPWVKISDATASNTRFIENTKGFIKKEGKNKSVSVISGDLIVSNSATPGLPKIMGIDACIHDGWLLLRNLNGVYKEFLFYLLTNDRKQIVSQGTGTVFTNLKTDILKNHQIKLPPISEQEEIASFLGSVDDKIELNQQMNQTLEEIAKTLFKSWFIDFDPVRAKAEGRPIALSKEISDLFPDSFEDSELGEIPRGWKAGNLGTFIEPKRGKVITKSKTTPGEVPVVAGGTKPPYYHSESNAIAPIVTISASGTAGYVNIYYEDIWASDCSYINKEVTDFVFFAHSFLLINQERIYDLRHGAVQQHVYPKDLIELEMVTPPTSIIEDYESKVSTFHERIKCNLEEIKTLQSLRDFLLPKLISGELQIPDAEDLVEKAGM